MPPGDRLGQRQRIVREFTLSANLEAKIWMADGIFRLRNILKSRGRSASKSPENGDLA
jgi:hypothetical protein